MKGAPTLSTADRQIHIVSKIKVVMEPQEDGGSNVHVPSLPGSISEGDGK